MHPLHYIPLMMAVLLTAACSSDTTVTEVKVIDTRPPMVFGTSSASASTETEVTRADVLETVHKDFKVGVWKAFGLSGQQSVMDGYKVDYTSTAKTDAPDGYNWYYEGVNNQILRYWDLSAFPYEFRAVAPYLSGATITSTGITVDVNSKPFKAQCLEGETYKPTNDVSEACMVAHVSRAKDGSNYVDRDIIKQSEISSTGDATREVNLPFHHLISKVGFRIYIDDPQPTSKDYKVVIKSLTITAEKDGFITESKKYTATYDKSQSDPGNLGIGTFSADATANPFTLITHDEYTGVDLRKKLHREDAFDLCPNFLQQIPQRGVKIRVKLSLETDHYSTGGNIDSRDKKDYERLLSLDRTKTTGDEFTWEPEKKYIYYLHIPNIHSHEIFLDTCEILDWDAVESGNIDIGL